MHVKQNHPDHLPIMQKSGCFVRSAGLVAEIHSGGTLKPDQVNGLWIWGKNRGFINQADEVVESAPLINQALKMLGVANGKFFEVGTFRNGKTSWYPSVPESMRYADAVIQKVRQGGPQKYHFRVVDKRGKLIEDPHDPPIKVLGIEYSILYCYKENSR